MIERMNLNCQPIKSFQNNTQIPFGNEKRAQQKGEEKPDSFDLNQVNETNPEISQRKFSFKNAGDNFWKGVTSPVQMLINNPLSAGATVLGGIGLKKLVSSYKRIGIIAVALSGAISAYTMGKGVLKLAKADTAEAKEKSFYDMGQGAILTALSVLPAKNVATANSDIIAGAENMKMFKSYAECIKATPKVVSNIVKNLNDSEKLTVALGGVHAIGTAGAIETAGKEAFYPQHADKTAIDVPHDLLDAMPQGFQQAVNNINTMAQDPAAGATIALNNIPKKAEEEEI
ncbi:MAG TPA: hypothetical protein P5556_04210 [Candidatus Gastranaerophilales bacterium]|nr:hypothetical protein [Candidatus Gastranaerophilales bacterium]